MQYTVRNRRRLKSTGSQPALVMPPPEQERTPAIRSSAPTVDQWLAATVIERARE